MEHLEGEQTILLSEAQRDTVARQNVPPVLQD